MALPYFLSDAADVADLSGWGPILPPRPQVLRTNLFGDAFLFDHVGAVHMLERGACVCRQIAPSQEQFWRTLENDEEGWQLRRLADACGAAGKVLAVDQCYAFTTLPVFGGSYSEENVRVAPWREWFSFTADIYRQTGHLPDGAAISLRVTD
ncbi:T6SS immunity protein Tdi1 domain-containing protein [Brevundimonas sp.]|uniref:T6SS immunity protein Tdi1 domain-containing protein n=1 Tax=Brevundimonas sp. TaxID=1871086 RepID=UPI002FCAC1EE